MGTTKPEWEKPELTILLRGRPEEAVLWLCKDFDRAGAYNEFNSCMAIEVDVCNFNCRNVAGS